MGYTSDHTQRWWRRKTISDDMDQVAYDIHVYIDTKYASHNDGDDNEDTDKIGEKPLPPVDIKYIYEINLEHNSDKVEEGIENLLDVKI